MLAWLFKRLIHRVMHAPLLTIPDAPAISDRAWADPGEPPALRADRVLQAMNLEEKFVLIAGDGGFGIRGLPRLGLPPVWMSDATSGPRCFGPTTAFPSAVAMAAAWDPGSTARAAEHIAEAARAKGVSILLGPGINIARIPTCGRNFEYMGEDPLLAGRVAAAYTAACRRRGVLCAVKHYVANNSEFDRHRASSEVDDRTLREIYLPAFRTVVKTGGAEVVMTAYNPVNGTWASESASLVGGILRSEWGFDGIVVSDWNSLYSTVGPVLAGLDLEMPGPRWFTPKRFRRALESGAIREADLDRMVHRILSVLFAAGVYDRPTKDSEARELHADHEQAALDAALSGIVLLENDGVLPLPDGKGRTVVVCGPRADPTPVLGGGSGYVARRSSESSLAEAMRRTAPAATIVHLPFRRWGPTRRECRILAGADAVVTACGFDHRIESELYDRPWRLPAAQRRLIRRVGGLNPRSIVVLFAGGDVETESWRTSVRGLVHALYPGQAGGQALAELLFGRENPSGRLPFTMARRWNDIAAVRDYPRRYRSTSAARMFIGQGNPRLRRIRRWRYTEGLMVGYRHFVTAGVSPAYPFGFGRSYTRFRYEAISAAPNSIGPNDGVDVRVRLRNIGERPGSEVVQIYVSDPVSRLDRPLRELRGFRKIPLEAGEAADVVIRLDPEAFRYWDPDAPDGGGWVAEPGEFRIQVCRDSSTVVLETTICLV